MKREDNGEMPKDNPPKKTKTGPTDEVPPAVEENGSQVSATPSGIDPSGSPRATSGAPSFRMPTGPNRTSSGYFDAAAEKLVPVQTMNLRTLQLPFQATPPGPRPRPRTRLSREEFRQRLIWTIEEALRIIGDDTDHEIPDGISRRED